MKIYFYYIYSKIGCNNKTSHSKTVLNRTQLNLLLNGNFKIIFKSLFITLEPNNLLLEDSTQTQLRNI